MYFSFNSGDYLLNGKIDFVSNNGEFIFYIPGISFSIDDVDYLSSYITNKGYNFVRFELKYHKKENNIENFNIESDLEDIKNAIKYIEDNISTISNIGILAKSLGSIKGFLLDDDRINLYCFLAPASYFYDNIDLDKIKKLNYINFSKLEDIKLDKDILKGINVTTMIIHGEDDDVVNISNSKYISSNIKNSELVPIPNMGHAIESDSQKSIIGNKISNFLISKNT